MRNRIYLLPYLYKNLNTATHSIRECRFQYQWYAKERSLNLSALKDMTDVAFSEAKQGKIFTSFNHAIYSDRDFMRLGQTDWQLTWDQGELRDQNRDKKIPGFHFIDLKNNHGFKMAKFDPSRTLFKISKDGIAYDS